MDARDFKLWDSTKYVVIRPPAQFSAWHYLRMLVPLPLLVWYWAGEALHRMELAWARSSGAELQPLEQACRTLAGAPCDAYLPIHHLHHWSLVMLLLILKFMLLAASLPHWPRQWQVFVLRCATWFGGLGLLTTLLLVMARGALAASAAWLLPPVWWGPDTKAVQLAAVLAVIAMMRLPPHIKMAWLLWRRFIRRRVGRVVGRDEQPALWAMIDGVSRKLEVAAPSHLVLGVFPDCRFEAGRMTLDPGGKIIKGDILYLGITLGTTLDPQVLRRLIEQALLRRRGVLGNWLPAFEDWLESSAAFLQDRKDKRAAMELGNAGDPAICCWDIWLQILRRMATPFQTEHAFVRTADRQQELEQQSKEAAALLAGAQQAYRKEVFILFIVNLTCGVACPAVLRWFAKAFSQYHPVVEAGVSSPAERALHEEVVLLEKEWLIKTGQASTPSDCWELRAA